jgi:hypothetical protein
MTRDATPSDHWQVIIVHTELASPVRLVARDEARLRVQLVNTGANVVVIGADAEALASPDTAFSLTPGGSIAIDTRAEIWGMSAATPAGGGPSEVSLVVEGRGSGAHEV